MARLEWDGPGCLYQNQTLVTCVYGDDRYVMDLGNSVGSARPAAGDVYTLWRPDGTTERRALRGVTRLAVVRR